MSYTNAGHNPPYVKKADGSVVTLDDRHGPVAGAIEGITFGSPEMDLEPGDTAVLYTDGVTEAMDVDHVQFTDAALETLIADATLETPEASVALVNVAVARHRGDAEQSDDITVLALEYKGADQAAALMELMVPATIESIGEVVERFEGFAEEHGLDDTVRRQVLLVLDDMLNNIASYAYEGVEPKEGETQEIEVRVELSPSRLVITITDAGVPFNPLGINAPDVQASLEERDIGGLGIHLVRTVMDELDYSRRGGRNVVTVTKRLESLVGDRFADFIDGSLFVQLVDGTAAIEPVLGDGAESLDALAYATRIAEIAIPRLDGIVAARAAAAEAAAEPAQATLCDVLSKGERRSQAVDATISANASDGFSQPRVCRGRPLS